jgi:predicted nucleic acid-binding protein
VQSVLLDAGALVAILNRNDRHHADLIDLLEGFDGRLFTTWPVIGEACALALFRSAPRFAFSTGSPRQAPRSSRSTRVLSLCASK